MQCLFHTRRLTFFIQSITPNQGFTYLLLFPNFLCASRPPHGRDRSHYVKLALILSLRALFVCLFSETSCFDSVSVSAFDLSGEQADDGYKSELPREHSIPFCSLHWPDSINITVIPLTYQLHDYHTHNTLSVPLFSYSLVEQPVRLPPSASSPAPPFRAFRSTSLKRAFRLSNSDPHNVIE